jgi:N-carbamoyl-L-amino-acid hydrolase
MVSDDEVGNLSGVLLCSKPKAKTLLLGSHLDTVPNGGLYDGTIGVLAGLECLRTLQEAKLDLPFHIEVIDFTDEEGTWQSFFGSMGLVGVLQDRHWNDAEQDNGAFRAALFRAGIRPSEVQRARRKSKDIVAYLELHIEQSEQLEKNNCQIGIVSKIVGRTTYNFNFHGEATHAATTNRDKQHDALQGACVFITEMHRMAREDYPGGVFNCGNVIVQPGAYNVVPDLASLRVELRHYDDTILSEMDTRLVQLAEDVAHKYRLGLDTQKVLHRPVAYMNQHLRQLIEDSCQEQRRTFMPIISYAGHDAQILSPSISSAMIFVPSQGGISHSPKEYTNWEDIEAGANLMLQTILHIIQEN